MAKDWNVGDAYDALLAELRRDRNMLSQTIDVLERQQKVRRQSSNEPVPARQYGVPLLQQIERLIAGGINERLAYGSKP